MNPTSTSLLNRLKEAAPDSPQWVRFHELYRPFIQYWIARIASAPGEVEDLTQEVLVVVVRELPRFQRQRDGSFRAWLRQVTLNRCRAFFKSRKHEQAASGDMLDQLQDPGSDLSHQWDRDHDRHVAGQLLRLAKNDFEATTWSAFERFALDGQPAAAVARELGMTENAVLLAKHRVLKRLREQAGEMLE
jgi:RNA polymerase sigma-70 factor (ECF subfamily)